MNDTRPTRRWLLAALLLFVLLVAAGLRFHRLPELPVGLHYDEAANGILASGIARGITFPVFISSYTGKEVLFFYWTAVWMRILGVTPMALRLGAASVGLLTVAATFWAVRELLHGRRDANWVALFTAAFLATSFWHLILSRYGFRAVTQPLMQALTVAALWRGLRTERRQVWLLLAGFLCGLTSYTYLAARAFPIPLATALLALLIADKERRRAHLGRIALFVAVAALTLAPLAHYWLTHPGSFITRTQQVAASSWAEAWAGFRACLGMFFLKGDPYVRFNLPRRPLFDPITAALFLIGFAIIVWRVARRPSTRLPSYIFLLVQLPVMLLPSALATGEITPSNLRAAGLLPYIFVFPALALSVLRSQFQRRVLSLITHCSLFIVLCALFILLLASTATAYFRDWAPSAALYYAADGDMADVAAYLNQADLAATTPYIASVHYRHPTLAFLADGYHQVRWLTGGRTLVFPADGEALLIFPHSASQDLAWVQSVLPDGSLAAAPTGPDGAAAFHAYRVGPTTDLAPAHPLSADLGHAALLLGYDVVGEPRAGETAELVVWWRVLNAPGQGDYATLVRLADPWGFLWSENRHAFHYPSEQWAPGEVVVDRLSIPVAPDAPPGNYLARLSFYSASAEQTLPVLDGDRYAGTYASLPLQVARAAKPPHPDDLGIRTRLDANIDGMTLLGVNLDTTNARPGERVFLTLFWRADEPIPSDRDATLTAGDTILYTGSPVHGSYPTSEWIAGEVVADRYSPRLPRQIPPGDYPLRLRIGDTQIDLGTVAVRPIDRTFDVPSIPHPLNAVLGDQVELLGYDLSTDIASPGDTLTLTLYWRALTEMDESYTVFVHLVAPDGSMAGQHDGVPAGGSYPTDLWLAGEVVADAHQIPISAGAIPGDYRIEVGMYVAETGERLPITGSPDDTILLQTIAINH